MLSSLTEAESITVFIGAATIVKTIKTSQIFIVCVGGGGGGGGGDLFITRMYVKYVNRKTGKCMH